MTDKAQDDIGSSGKSVALEARETAEDGRRYSPSAARNKDVLADVIAANMPVAGHILEIASGTGEHGAHFVSRFPSLQWSYTDLDEMSLASQRAWARLAEGAERLHGPLKVDASQDHWGEAENPSTYDGLFCANMIHIAPFAAARGLLTGAGRLLRTGGRLMLYGPFAREGQIAPSNARFSEDLQRRDPDWGVRDLDLDIVPIAEAASLCLFDVIEMPANNLSVIFEKIKK
ncbi:DUF938 domain-containing protein [Henriciella litoralis]|uniref:DUF938 domain-containing protein n=1 Tax=Henriciella litoralis TaxID=568102 RepID=UPI000A03FA72|nr:DUF938 domain-containing protein [Henriciella litoralis]